MSWRFLPCRALPVLLSITGFLTINKEGCQLLPEDAEFDLEEIAVENGLEPCHFCIMSADYSSGYQAGYAAGWVDRANDILSGE